MNQAVAANAVAARFSAAASTYDKQSEIQGLVAERLMDGVLDTGKIDRILEIGCGTGTLTEMIRRRFPRTTIHAVDIAEGMIELARKRLGQCGRVEWSVTDARKFKPHDTFPLVMSSSALHWMTPLHDILKRIESLLEPGGSLVASLMVEGTFEELQASRRRVAPMKPAPVLLPRVEDVLHAVRISGLTLVNCREERLEARYECASAFLRSLNEQGVTGACNAGCLLNRSELRRIMQDYDCHYACRSGGVFTTYRVLYIKAWKGGFRI